LRAETRHQLKQDKFSRTTIQVAEKTVHWTVDHKNKLIVAVVVIVALAAAALGTWYYLERQDEKASADFGKATLVLDTPVRPAGMPPQPEYPSYASSKERAADARKQFQAVIDKYPHTRAADFSHYFLGVTAASVGDNATAERELKTVAGYHNEDLSALAKLALAGVYRNTNRTKDAIDVYKQLIDKPTRTVGKTAAEMELAQTYEVAGLKAEAKKQYEQIQKDAPQSQAAQLASAKLQELK
jgi:predicted negative regulator of RcsB-dependent stress response